MNITRKEIEREEIEVRKEYPNKKEESVLYLAIGRAIRHKYPNEERKEILKYRKQIFNQMKGENMKTLRFDQIEGKSFSIVGIRHYTGVNQAVEEGEGILSVEDNNIILKNNNGEIVGSMLSSDTKMNELVELGVPKNALTQQKTFKIKNISKDVFDNVKVIVQQYIHNECVIVKIKENKGDENMIKENAQEEILKNIITGDISPMFKEELENLHEALEKAYKEYPQEIAKAIPKGNDVVYKTIEGLRQLDNIIGEKYLNDEIDGGEFDHVRVWLSYPAYTFYKHNVEKIEMEDFFTKTSIKASEKFLEEEKSRRYVEEEEESSSSTVELIDLHVPQWAACGATMVIKVNGDIYKLKHFLGSGGSVWFDDDWNEHVEHGEWNVMFHDYPELEEYRDEIETIVRENIPDGCCGGCV